MEYQTVREIIAQAPEFLKLKLIKYVPRAYMDEKNRSLANVVSSLFDWEATDEGEQYWNNIFQLCKHYENSSNN